MTTHLEDRLWSELEAAAEREANRGPLGRAGAAVRAAVSPRHAIPAVAVAVALIAIVATLARPGEQWRVERFTVAGASLDAAATGFGSVWTYDLRSGHILRVDPRSRRVVARVSLRSPLPNVALAIGAGAVWAVPIQPSTHTPAPADPSPGTLVRIDPRSNRVVARVTLRAPDGSTLLPTGAVASTDAVWVWGEGGAQRIDPNTNRVTAVVAVPGDRVLGFAAGDARVSLATDLGHLVSFDARSGARVATVPVPSPRFDEKLVAVGGAVVLDRQDGSIASIDATTGATRWIARLGREPSDIALSDGRLWVLVPDAGAEHDQLLALDPGTGHVDTRITLPDGDARALAPDGAAPLVTTQGGDVVVLRPSR